MKLAGAILLSSASAAWAFTSSEAPGANAPGRANLSARMSTEVSELGEPAVIENTPRDELVDLAKGLNPIIGYWDPLALVDSDVFKQGIDETIGFLRQAEIKHGRVAMAAFVGYWVQSNYHFPFANTLAGAPFPDIDLSPEAQWDALPQEARWQIILVVGLFEFWDEWGGGDPDRKHYMRGGRPGDYPSFDRIRAKKIPLPDLYDPFGFFKKMTQEKKERRLLMEINNGRLAMLGIFGFLAADTVEGSVPLLNSIAIPYDGNFMAPFQADGSLFN